MYSLVVEINLLPAQYRKSSEPGLWRLATIALPVITVLAIVAFSAAQQARLKNIQTQLDDANGQITALSADKTEFDGLNRQKNDLQKVTDVAAALQTGKTYWSTDLARFVNALPSGGGVALTTMTVRSVDSNTQANLAQQGLYNGKVVSKEFDLTGQAVSSEALVAFLNSFETNPNFGVNFRSAQRATVAPGALDTAKAKASQPYIFNASVGMVGQPTAAASTTAPATGTAGGAGTTGSSNVR